MVINNNYIYVNEFKFGQSKSLRFNMDTWKCEKLIKKDNEYIYVPSDYYGLDTPNISIPQFLKFKG
jgi:hypothetical protein